MILEVPVSAEMRPVEALETAIVNAPVSTESTNRTRAIISHRSAQEHSDVFCRCQLSRALYLAGLLCLTKSVWLHWMLGLRRGGSRGRGVAPFLSVDVP